MSASIVWVPIYLFLQACFVWVLNRRLKNPSLIDVFWGIGLVVAGWMYLWPVTRNLRLFITACLLLVWGLRLSTYLFFTRILHHQPDARYDAFAKNIFVMFQWQALCSWIIASVFWIASYSLLDTITWMDIIAYVVVILGILGESISDYQLYSFRKHYPGEICQRGWWRLSRHPNTFFDWLTWCGFFMIASQSHYGFAAIISPLFLYWIMNGVTNPITERHSLQVKGEAYREYQKKTSPFFPMHTNF